ncbi:hypothetical protein CL6EHI_034570 [Entamoeba histolytica]|uniref:NadR/Ttd14 AAA domain-containing protein n=2 Tax=Entamoeba histolytica TaxID=5759 RepID=C4M973_ENTH1|nr:hypothetical protein EHI_034570 [Entamoeba histolytica HM-1:IMSS]EAL42588.1 hypothetical protein EHI_034570 [Entamoeba histolytica HM-1:IMSS]GAT98198.1 hypothetical protein CL6EHI_034570 [Entamoeba histolytica]|eukprot:XP_647974.1 hypothetical protein EHI_034570 [Entamoeba histolytica HM-1:IMSS]
MENKIIISGGIGTGKTTIIKALAKYFNPDEVGIIEEHVRWDEINKVLQTTSKENSNKKKHLIEILKEYLNDYEEQIEKKQNKRIILIERQPIEVIDTFWDPEETDDLLNTQEIKILKEQANKIITKYIIKYEEEEQIEGIMRTNELLTPKALASELFSKWLTRNSRLSRSSIYLIFLGVNDKIITKRMSTHPLKPEIRYDMNNLYLETYSANYLKYYKELN